MGKRGRTVGLERRTVDSAVHEFRVDYEQAKQLAIGKAMYSEPFSAGAHMWRVYCYPRGRLKICAAEHLSIFAKLVNKSRSVNAIFEVFLMTNDGRPCHESAKRTNVQLFQRGMPKCGWDMFISHTKLEEYYLTAGHITFICAIMVVQDNSIPVPPSDIKKHFGTLLDSTEGTDVSFTIDGETFHAHRAVLAARSPVFKAELFGFMAEATMSSISLHEITPATFRAMLRFVYTDALPEHDELGDSSFEIMQHLLAAADRYALDRLKLVCAQRLWENVSVDNVATTLACAEMYSCSELKSKCIDFFAVDNNFKKAVLTEGFVQLGQKFPSIIAELRERVGA
ncbi:hypothetical protein ACP70R_016111 [Stipagrostis hirtigluma subsp. patula]